MSHNMHKIAAQLRESGYRVTPQRQIILDAVCQLGGHVTPEEVYNHVHAITPALNRTTVYRTLHFLSEQRIITVAQMPDGRFGYELAFEEPHHHLICRRCEASIEISHNLLKQLFSDIEKKHQFAIDMDHISFFGLCASCRQGK